MVQMLLVYFWFTNKKLETINNAWSIQHIEGNMQNKKAKLNKLIKR